MASSYMIDENDEALIDGLVESGRYKSASEVVRAGLRLVQLREQDYEAELAELRALIQEGLDSGPAIEITDIDQFFEDVKARGRQRLAQERAK